VVGVIFLWAGLEKLLAPEPFSAAGFLQFATGGSLGWPFVSGEVAEGTIFNPTHDFWAGMATNGAAMGTLMMLLFFVAAWEFEFGIVNQHLTYGRSLARRTWRARFWSTSPMRSTSREACRRASEPIRRSRSPSGSRQHSRAPAS
jgi:hypothetical protein